MQKAVVWLLIVAMILGLLIAAWAYRAYHIPLLIDSEQSLLIESGDHVGGLGSELAASGWLPWPEKLFGLYGRATLSQGHIKKGEYAIQPGTTVPQLLSQLRRGDVVQRTVTFPEGWSTAQWIELLANIPLLEGNDLESIETELGPTSTLEGRLFPDTYAYTRGDSAVSILRRARSRMDQVLAEVWRQRSANIAVENLAETLVLASIIEKETGYEGDRRLISSVFSNRLNKGMKLQSDPTVIYGLIDFDGDLKRRHLSIPHEFNTYVIPGLPIGPICNPGRRSLEAALDPEVSPYLYFVARGDGRSQFSVTLAEHNRAVVQFQKTGRVENYRSAPPEPD